MDVETAARSEKCPLSASPKQPVRPGRFRILVQKLLRAYRAAHVTAEEFRYCQKRVRRLLGLRPLQGREKRLPEVLTPVELARMLAEAYRACPRDGLIVRTLFETGTRVSELVNVEVADADFAERTIRVRQGKGGKDRVVLFTEDLGQQLRLHLGTRTCGYLFETNRDGRFTPRRVQQIVQAIARRAGIVKHIHPHTYRHSMATFLRNQGVPLDVVQLLLGHSDPKTTQIYARLSLATVREEYDRAMAKTRPPAASPINSLVDHATSHGVS